jgi:hypothetical protein
MATTLVFNAAFDGVYSGLLQGRTTLTTPSDLVTVASTVATAIETALGAGSITVASQQLLLVGICSAVLSGRYTKTAADLTTAPSGGTSVVAKIAALYTAAASTIVP